MTPDANDLCVFAVKRGYIESKEIYCNPLYPTYLSLVEKYQHSPYANGILNNHVAVNPKTDCSLLSDSSEVSFVPMANVQEKTNVVSYDMVAYETVKKGFTVFQRGDLIWAKITPCMQNGKSCIVDKMPTEIGFGSTEFHVIRKRNENVYMPFIWAILSSDDVLKAAQATFSGSAGQQRVSASFIENFPAVLPDYPVQVRLVAELEDKLNLLNGKLQRAYELLHKTPMYLIDRLGLTFDFSATQKITYATTVANIEGRIDADYYSPKFSHFRSQIEALPYRTVSVDDISEKIVSGFAAGKQDQADNLPEDQRVPHLRPFSITPEGELSFETKKYVPKSRLKSEDYCKKNEVIFNNTNSPDLVGKTTVFDSDVLCAASNHMTRITVKEGVNPYYVAAFFNVLLSIGYWKLLCTNFNNQAGVNTDKPFRRVDGNHRLLAIEKLIAEGQMRSNYLIPFCIIVFPDNVSMKDEKIIFHNINSKAVPIRSERLLEGIIVDSKDELSFSDKELDDSFGHEYLLARKVLKNKPLAIRKLKAIPWIRSDLITALIDIIESIQKRFGNIQTAEHEEAFGIALSNALNDAKLGENGTLLISSGLLFLLVALYYNIEISSPSADAVQYKDRLLTWSEKYQITDAQIDTEQNAASNAECIEAIFNRYVRSTEQTIFMSRCFSAEYNETENAIRRAINEINNEKKTGIMLIRVDEHHEGTTGQISDRIFRDIESAGLVIADLSSGKLNVPHEIGYAMGLKKDLILVHNGTSEEAEKHIPSNIRMFEQIRFNGDYQTLQNEIKRRLIDYYKL